MPASGDHLTAMLSLSRPIGRIPFVIGVGLANSALVLAILISFAFLPVGAGHMAVLVIVGALMWWWFALHARRFASAGRGLAWPAIMALVAYGSFALSYAIIAALWSVPEVQQAAFRTGGTDFTKHVETIPLVAETGRWLASWVGAAGAIVVAGLLATGMGVVALVAGVFSVITLLLPAAGPNPGQRLVAGVLSRR